MNIMTLKKEKYFFCEYFRLAYLFKLLLKGWFFRNVKITIYYFKASKNPLFIAKEQKRKVVPKFFSNWITIKQSPYSFAEINKLFDDPIDKKARIDAVDCVISRIGKKFLESKVFLFKRLDDKFSVLEKSISLYIKHEITFDIIDDLLLVEGACRLANDTKSIFYGQDLAIFVDRKNYWSRFVLGYAQEKRMPFIDISKFIFNRNKAIQFLFYAFQLFTESAVSFLAKNPRPSYKIRTNKIGIPHYYYENFSKFFEKKNYYLFWYPESKIDPKRIIIYFDGNVNISLEEKERLETSGFTLLACNNAFRRHSIPKYKCTSKVISLFFSYTKQLMLLLFYIRNRLLFEQWKILLVLLVRLPYWEDFFAENNIKVKFRFHDIFSPRDIAANLAGAATVSYHYTNHSVATFSMLNRDICDVFFVWGKEYEKLFSDDHSDVKNIVHTGYIFDYTFDVFSKKSGWLKKKFNDKGMNFIISIMDEKMTHYCRENILSLYSTILNLLLEDSCIVLIIKPKVNKTIDFLKSSEKTSRIFNFLEKEKRIEIFDSSKYPIEAGKASDLVIGVYADSSAAMECALAGIPSIICECCFGMQKAHPYYAQYKNKIFFYDFQTMIEAIKKYKLDRYNSDGFGDWTGILERKDSFRDGKANQRIGLYIKTLLDKFDSGLEKGSAIKEANRIYSELFGKDKVVSLL